MGFWVSSGTSLTYLAPVHGVQAVLKWIRSTGNTILCFLIKQLIWVLPTILQMSGDKAENKRMLYLHQELRAKDLCKTDSMQSWFPEQCLDAFEQIVNFTFSFTDLI